MKINKSLTIFSLILVTVSYFLMNHLTPMTLDDCGYALNISNLKDIITSQINDYFIINGRVISHGIVQLFCALVGKEAFNFFNSVMYTLMILLIVRHGGFTKSYKNYFLAVFLAFLFCWLFLPDQYITTLLIAGSMNYVWATTIILGFLLFYWYFVIPYKGRLVFLFFPLVLISFLTGAFVEMYSVAVLPALFVWHFVNKVKINKTSIISISGFIIGSAFLVLAPGNFVRYNNIAGNGNISISNLILQFTSNLLNEELIILFVILIITWFIINKSNKELILEFARENVFYITAIIFSLFFIFASGAGWSRTFFGVYVFLFILTLKIIKKIFISNLITYIAYITAFIFLTADIHKEFIYLKYNRKIYDDLVCQLSDKGIDVIFFSDTPKKTRKNNTEILALSSCSWKNKGFSAFHNHKSVACMTKEIHDSLYISPIFVDSIYKQCENCYSTSDLRYYIIPFKEDSLIEKLTLVYSDENEIAVPKKQIKRILSILFLDDYFYSLDMNNISTFCKKILYKKIKSHVVLNQFNYASLITHYGKYLIVENNNQVTKYGGDAIKLKKIFKN